MERKEYISTRMVDRLIQRERGGGDGWNGLKGIREDGKEGAY